jgi:hypothetical protein
MERSVGYAVLDNIIGFDDDHLTPGEKLGKAVGEDPFGVATTVVKGVGKVAKSAFDKVLEEGPLDALTGSLSDYSKDLVGAGTRLKSGTQGYIDSGMTQAEARDAQISDALRLSEIIPLVGSGVAGLRAGRLAVPEAPFDPSRRSFLGGIAALPAVAAVAPDALSGALKSVGPKVARATSSLDVSVAKINDLLKQKDLLSRQADELRNAAEMSGLPKVYKGGDKAVRKDIESFEVQDEIEQAAKRALDDLSPTDLSNAADDSIEMIAEQFSTSRALQSDLDNPAFDGLMKQVRLRGMNTAKDSKGIDKFPYARSIYEDYYDPINVGEATISRSVFEGPQSLNMAESAPPVGRQTPPDIAKDIVDLEILSIRRNMMLEEKRMIAEGKSSSEIDAMKAKLRQKIYKLQGSAPDTDDFFADGGEVMDGIGSLNETARGMSRGPRGIGAYQQYAGGGPVYMANGGSPQELMAQQAYRQQMKTAMQQAPMQTAQPMNIMEQPMQAEQRNRKDFVSSFMRFPTVSPQAPPSNIRGDGMSANDLQRMLSRQAIAPENVADVQSDIQRLQQADVAKRAAARRDEAARRAREGNNPIPEATPQPMPMPMGPFGGSTPQPMPMGPFGGSAPQPMPMPMGQPMQQPMPMGQPMQQPMNIMGQPMQQPMPMGQPMSQPMPMGQPMSQPMGQPQFGGFGIGSLFRQQQQNTGGVGSPQPTANVLF